MISSKALFFAIPLLLLTVVSFGQQKLPNDFFETETEQLIGKIEKISDTEIRFRRMGEINFTIYGVDQIKQFRVDGIWFEPLLLDGKKRFVRQLFKGKVSLYKEQDRFYFKLADSAMLIEKNNYKARLGKELNCPASEKVSFSRASLVSFFRQYDKKNCDITYVPYPRVGLSAGPSLMSLERKIGIKPFTAKATGLSFSGFYEMPFYAPRSVFFTTEVQITTAKGVEYEFSRNTYTGTFEVDFFSVALPVGVKWVLPKGNVRPFFKGGVMPSYSSTKANTPLKEVVTDINTPSTETSPMPDYTETSLGFFAATGLEFSIMTKTILFLEGRYAVSSVQGNDTPNNYRSVFGVYGGIKF